MRLFSAVAIIGGITAALWFFRVAEPQPQALAKEALPATNASVLPDEPGQVSTQKREILNPVNVSTTSLPTVISTRAAVESNASQGILLLPKGSGPTATNSQRSTQAVFSYPRAVQDVLEAQIALARQGISSGPVDGLIGNQTRAAVLAFQREQGLPETGELDEFTRELLILDRPAFRSYAVTSNDLARLTPIHPTWVGKSQQERLDYETLLELVAEMTRSHPNLIRKLNPAAEWSIATPGTALLVPDTDMRDMRKGAAFIRISLSARTLQAFDSSTNLLAHFPCSIAQRVEKRPAGELFITAIAPDPNYTFDPAMFPESTEARELKRKLILPPGPNNPVGVAWISLSRPGYGIHGTPVPEHVGRTESHGCFRLANWNAAHLLRVVRIGLPVYVE